MATSLDAKTSLNISEKIGQLFFIGIPGPELDESTIDLVTDVSPGGICLFGRNIKGFMQVRELLDGLTASSKVQPFLSVDQEGGLVDRLRRLMTPMPAAEKVRFVDDAERLGGIAAEALRILGFNMDFAPVVDVVDEVRGGVSNGLVSRTYGRSPQEVIELAGAFLSSLEAGGCLGTLKHFPGLGASAVDSHEDLPVVQIGEDEFERTDLAPYASLLKTHPLTPVMVGHAAYPGLNLQETDQNGKLLPSSLSQSVISGLLREKMNFRGLVITDDLEMGAILKNYGVGEACKMAVKAGADMLAICAGVDSIYQGFEAVSAAVNSGEITEQRIDGSLRRIAAAKARLSGPLPFDEVRLGFLSDQIAEVNARLN
jgi:beta-N-acetylhexosaminidase